MWVFVFQKYGKFWSILLGHFIKDKLLISEKWKCKYDFTQFRLYIYNDIFCFLTCHIWTKKSWKKLSWLSHISLSSQIWIRGRKIFIFDFAFIERVGEKVVHNCMKYFLARFWIEKIAMVQKFPQGKFAIPLPLPWKADFSTPLQMCLCSCPSPLWLKVSTVVCA